MLAVMLSIVCFYCSANVETTDEQSTAVEFTYLSPGGGNS